LAFKVRVRILLLLSSMLLLPSLLLLLLLLLLRLPLPLLLLLLSQAAFHVFGMELLTQLDLTATNDFFKTFFALPGEVWGWLIATCVLT
jgi:hypothetical protein